MSSLLGSAMHYECAECPAEAGGRCPECHRRLCPDHFGRQAHAPCATRQEQYASEHFCYVCGVPAIPTQWSRSLVMHYVDAARCEGCHRPLCAQHTAWQGSYEQVTRDGLRGLRYHTVRRYCHLCAPFRRWGGLIGITRGFVAVGTVIVSVAIALHR